MALWVNGLNVSGDPFSGALSERLDFSTSGKLIRRDVSTDSSSAFARGIGAKAVQSLCDQCHGRKSLRGD